MSGIDPEEIDVLIAPIVAEILEALFDPAAGERVTRQRVAQALAEVAVQAVDAAITQQQDRLPDEQTVQSTKLALSTPSEQKMWNELPKSCT